VKPIPGAKPTYKTGLFAPMKPGFEVRTYLFAKFPFRNQTPFAGIQPSFYNSKTGLFAPMKPGFEVRTYLFAKFPFPNQTPSAGIQPGFYNSKTGFVS
jgi:hypothetical protein